MLLVINSIFIGLVLMLITITLIDNYQHRKAILNQKDQIADQNEMILRLANQIGDAITISEKTLDKIKQLGTHVNKEIKEIDSDMSSIVQLVKNVVISQEKGMRVHNQLVDYVRDEISKLWCDAYEGQCEACPNEENCRSQEKDCGFQFTPFEFPEEDSEVKTEKMSIDPHDSEQLEELLNKMKESGVPGEVVNHCEPLIRKIMQDSKSNKVDFVWKLESVDKSIEKREKLIDPNSKIVKSLEKLFKL